MSFAARLGALTHELVELLLPDSFETNSALRTASDSALKRLKTHKFLQTNHFEVEKALNGLDERFRVNDRDDLADALRLRLNSLRLSSSKWHPEILHLLLETSDQPTFKSKISDLELLRAENVPASTPLRWEDIAREDGWDHDELLWKDVDYNDGSEDEGSDGLSTVASEPTSTCANGDHGPRIAESYVTHPEDQTTFEQVQVAQKWRTQCLTGDSSSYMRKVAISEIQVVREVLFMLQGLDSTLFARNSVVAQSLQLGHMEWETYRAMMQSFADFGNHLRTLRSFVEERQDVPHLQAFQDCISDRLHKLDVNVADLQKRLAAPTSDYVLSLVRIKAELMPWLEPLYVLADIITQVDGQPHVTPFRYLELVFDETCLAQLSGKPQLYEFLAHVFAECFKVYLRPIRLWMDEGKLLSASDLFFVAEASTNTPLGRTWQDRYYLRRNIDGALHAPAFLRTAVGNIYNAGKNIIVLKLLGKHNAAMSQKQKGEPPLDFAAICPAGQELVPFSELFDMAFDRWIQSKYRSTSTILKNALFEDWALFSTLDTLRGIYLMSDGLAAATCADSIFGKLDALETDWSDRRALTAACQDAFASAADPSRLSVNVELAMQQCPATEARDSVKAVLGSIRVDYRLPWPLQMILTDDSMQRYQSLFTFLLQLKRATNALFKQKMLDNYWKDGDNWNTTALFYAIRSKLVWFCTTIQTYLITLVLTPTDIQLRRDLACANDMDEIIATHEQALKTMVNCSCLGSQLTPIRESILDVLNLALRLELLRNNAAKKESNFNTSQEEMLRGIKQEVDDQVRFISAGLRSIAGAASDTQSARWDMLADMLQAGDLDKKHNHDQ